MASVQAMAVIGAAFGDEGKGLMTDYLTRRCGDPPLNIRFNGGAQAGHTVVFPNGIRHVFHHYGAGTLAGAQTYLSRDFLVNPILWAKEVRELVKLEETIGGSFNLRLLIDREAPVTTIYDMLVNQGLEIKRGAAAHGSCGAGIQETVLRQRSPEHRIFAADLFEPRRLYEAVARCQSRAMDRAAHLGISTDHISHMDNMDAFVRDCLFMAGRIDLVDSREIARWKSVIFEGAQGLLLDAKNIDFFPHLTPSRTGMTNVIRLCQEAGIEHIKTHYVMRSYLTRHGNGLLPGHDPALSYRDDTNRKNQFQGELRFAPMIDSLIQDAIERDIMECHPVSINPRLVVTHQDQKRIDVSGWGWRCSHESHGPTAGDVYPGAR
jgi:adenylosuccinate synthase